MWMCPDAMNNHVYGFEEIVIGRDLKAAIYAYYNSLPLISVEPTPPLFFEKLPKEPELFGQKSAHQRLLWDRLVHLMALSGLSPLSDNASSVRISDGIVDVVTNGSRNIKIKAERIRIFDDHGVFGLNAPLKKNSSYRVLDWMAVRTGGYHQLEHIIGGDDFVKEIHFYQSKRSGVKKGFKDVLAISYLDESLLQSHEYSAVYARFKTAAILKEKGLRGKKTSTGGNYLVKLENFGRGISPNGWDLYEDVENIVFDYRSVEQLLEEEANKPLTNEYLSKLEKVFYG